MEQTQTLLKGLNLMQRKWLRRSMDHASTGTGRFQLAEDVKCWKNNFYTVGKTKRSLRHKCCHCFLQETLVLRISLMPFSERDPPWIRSFEETVGSTEFISRFASSGLPSLNKDHAWHCEVQCLPSVALKSMFWSTRRRDQSATDF